MLKSSENIKALQNWTGAVNPTAFGIPLSLKYASGSLFSVNIGTEIFQAGVVSVNLDGSRLCSGIYFYKATAGEYSRSEKCH